MNNSFLFNNQNEINVAAYCRVSTLKDDQLNSFEYQNDYFTDFINQYPNFKMYKVYADKGKSATSVKKREEFISMLTDAGLDVELYRKEYTFRKSTREPKFKYILIKDVSRFARDVLNMEVIRKLREKEVYVYFTIINKSTEVLSEDFILSLFMLFAEQDSRDKSIKVKFGQEQGAKKGVILTADKFYGYRYIKETNELEIVEEEAQNIKKMYELYLADNGFRKILQYLDQNNIRTRAGKKFVQQSVKRILENPAYKGWLVRNKMDAPHVFDTKTYATLKAETEWIVHKGRIPAIVSENDWDSVQELRKSKVHYKSGKGIHQATSEYAGLIICKQCGNTFTKNREARSGRDYYNCRLKKKEGIEACHSPNIDKNFIDANVQDLAERDFYQTFIDNKDIYLHYLTEEVKPKLLDKIDKESSAEVAKLTQQKNELELQKGRVVELYVEGRIDLSKLDEMNGTLDSKLNAINKEITDKSMTNEDIFNLIKQIDETVQNIRELTLKKKFTKEEIIAQISSIEVLKTTMADETEADVIMLHYTFKNYDVFSKINQHYKEVSDIKYSPGLSYQYQ